MEYSVKQFNENGFAYLKRFVDFESCEKLTARLKDIVDSGQTEKDEQCPLSEAIHGAPVFDSLLEQLLPHVEKASGKRLYPTYAYARLYAPGDELKVHQDRDACEISVTLTLGYEGAQWPIFMGNNEDKSEAAAIFMEVGDAILYKGREKWHWREKFMGAWQAQVFLHYVDADGPYADQKYDGRKTLSHHDEDTSHLFMSFENALSKSLCQQIMDITERNALEKGLIGAGAGEHNPKIRNVNKISLSLWRGAGAILTGIGLNANAANWQFDITRSDQTDYLLYDQNGHYKAHIDTFFAQGQENRKLTVLAFLNENFEGGRLFFIAGNNKIYPPQKAGSVLVFPSFFVHGVEPVTNGIRRTVVTWLVGPPFK